MGAISRQIDVYSVSSRGLIVRQLGGRRWAGHSGMETLHWGPESCEKVIDRSAGEEASEAGKLIPTRLGGGEGDERQRLPPAPPGKLVALEGTETLPKGW